MQDSARSNAGPGMSTILLFLFYFLRFLFFWYFDYANKKRWRINSRKQFKIKFLSFFFFFWGKKCNYNFFWYHLTVFRMCILILVRFNFWCQDNFNDLVDWKTFFQLCQYVITRILRLTMKNYHYFWFFFVAAYVCAIVIRNAW